MPKCISFDIVVVRSQTGPLVALVKVRSVEIVSGRKPWSSAFSIIGKLKWLPAVGAVEDDPVPLRLDDLLQHQLLFRPHDAVGAAVIAVGDDVAGRHLGEDVGQRDRRVGDVDHQRHPGHRRPCGAPS